MSVINFPFLGHFRLEKTSMHSCTDHVKSLVMQNDPIPVAIACGGATTETVQRIFVMRHGERHDTLNPNWKQTAVRPYDTPITDRGKREAHRLSQERFSGKGIKRVYSSPFLRCLQTAAQAATSLGLEGLCVSKQLSEIMTVHCGMTGHPEVPCEDISSYDVHIKQQDLGTFPNYPETTSEAVERYIAELRRLADSHWPDNLLLVTHEYGVISAMKLGGCTQDTEAIYCGSVELLRRKQTQHNWTILQYHGVYMYDNVCDV